jgi:hypothetical protein
VAVEKEYAINKLTKIIEAPLWVKGSSTWKIS